MRGGPDKSEYVTEVFQPLCRKELSVRDGAGKVSIEMEYEAGGEQKQEQGVHGGPNKNKYMAGGRQEQEHDTELS